MNSRLSLQEMIAHLKKSDSSYYDKHLAQSIENHEKRWGSGTVQKSGELIYYYAPAGKKIDHANGNDEYAPEFKLEKLVGETDSQKNVIEALRKWKYPEVGFYIYGKCGSGKTTMLEAFTEKHKNNSYGLDIKFFSYSEIVKGLTNRKENRMLSLKNMKQSREVSVSDWYCSHCKNASILIIDDFLSNDSPFHPVENIQEFLDYRIRFSLPTFLSSNVRIKDVLSDVNERIGDRLLKLTKSMECQVNESYRLKQQRKYHSQS